MEGYVERILGPQVESELSYFPVVAIIGPRQCGKSTLARRLLESRGDGSFVDLERPADLAKLADAETFFSLHANELLCLDEIRKRPELFPIMRAIVDERSRGGQFLVLGSASPELLRQSSESLAGRIAYLELRPFQCSEVPSGLRDLRKLWLRGGFPRSYLAPSRELSRRWREEFVRTYLERDIPSWGFRIPSTAIGRLWNMCAHEHGQILNLSRLGQALGVSHQTVRAHVDILVATFMLRQLPPYLPNIGKRLVKSPRIYLRDTGILHSLLGLDTFDDLLGHPCYGSSWEGLVIEHVTARLPAWSAHFYRTKGGAEVDLVLERGGKTIVIEAKASAAPRVERGFWSALDDLRPVASYVVAPVEQGYPFKNGVKVCTLPELLTELDSFAD